jgi:hypothetical protein
MELEWIEAIRAKCRFPRHKPSFVVRPFIGPLPYKPRVQTTEEMLAAAGIGPKIGDPFSDPLCLPAERAAERERIRNHIQLWRENSGPFSHGYDSMELTINGRKESHPTWQVISLLEQIAYEALKGGANVREVAALSHLSVSEVKEVAERHSIPIET